MGRHKKENKIKKTSNKSKTDRRRKTKGGERKIVFDRDACTIVNDSHCEKLDRDILNKKRKAEANLQKTRANLHDERQRSTYYEGSLHEMTSKYSNLERERNAEKNRANNLQTEKIQLEKNVHLAEGLTQCAYAEINTLEYKQKQLINERDKLKIELENEKDQVQILQRSNNELKQQIDNVNTTLRNKELEIHRLTLSIQKLEYNSSIDKDRISQVENQLLTLYNEKMELESNLIRMKLTNKDQEANITKLNIELAETLAYQETLTSIINQNRTNMSRKNTEINKLQREYDRVMLELQQANEKNRLDRERLNNSIETLTVEINELRQENLDNINIKRALESAESKLIRLQKERDALENELMSVRQELTMNITDNIREKEKITEEFRKQIDKLTNNVKNKDLEINTLTSQLREEDAKSKVLSTRLQHLQTQFDIMSNEKHQLEIDLHTQLRQNTALLAQKNTNNTKYRGLLDENEKLSLKIRKIHDDNIQLRREKRELSNSNYMLCKSLIENERVVQEQLDLIKQLKEKNTKLVSEFRVNLQNIRQQLTIVKKTYINIIERLLVEKKHDKELISELENQKKKLSEVQNIKTVEINGLQMIIDTLNKELDETTKQFREEKTKLEEIISKNDEKIRDLEAKQRQGNNDTGDLKSLIQQLRDENVTLQEKLSSILPELNNARRQVSVAYRNASLAHRQANAARAYAATEKNRANSANRQANAARAHAAAEKNRANSANRQASVARAHASQVRRNANAQIQAVHTNAEQRIIVERQRANEAEQRANEAEQRANEATRRVSMNINPHTSRNGKGQVLGPQLVMHQQLHAQLPQAPPPQPLQPLQVPPQQRQALQQQSRAGIPFLGHHYAPPQRPPWRHVGVSSRIRQPPASGNPVVNSKGTRWQRQGQFGGGNKSKKEDKPKSKKEEKHKTKSKKEEKHKPKSKKEDKSKNKK